MKNAGWSLQTVNYPHRVCDGGVTVCVLSTFSHQAIGDRSEITFRVIWSFPFERFATSQAQVCQFVCQAWSLEFKETCMCSRMPIQHLISNICRRAFFRKFKSLLHKWPNQFTYLTVSCSPQCMWNGQCLSFKKLLILFILSWPLPANSCHERDFRKFIQNFVFFSSSPNQTMKFFCGFDESLMTHTDSCSLTQSSTWSRGNFFVTFVSIWVLWTGSWEQWMAFKIELVLPMPWNCRGLRSDKPNQI